MHKHAAVTALAIALITMLTLAVSASLTPANAATPYCHWGMVVRAGMPCVFLPRFGWRGYAIIEPPHNGTAVLRA
jgi:hypothetical protein